MRSIRTARAVDEAVASVVGLALAACSPPDRGPRRQAAGGTPHTGGTLHLAITDSVSTLDPAIAYDEILLLRRRTRCSRRSSTTPRAGPSSSRGSPNAGRRAPTARPIRFWLRPNLTFGDGTPIVVGALQVQPRAHPRGPRLAVRPVPGRRGRCQAVIDGKAADCAGIAAPSDRELVIALSTANVAFPYVMTMTFTTPQRADHVASAAGQLRRSPLSTGPYLLAAWDEGRAPRAAPQPALLRSRRATASTEIELLENIPRDTQFLMFEPASSTPSSSSPHRTSCGSRSSRAWLPYIHQTPMLSSFGSRLNVRVRSRSTIAACARRSTTRSTSVTRRS